MTYATYELSREHKELALQLRDSIRMRGYGSAVFEPGNGTRIAVGAMRVRSDDFGGTMLVSIPDFHKSYVVQLSGYYTPNYVNEKFGLGGSDLSAFTAFLNEVCS